MQVTFIHSATAGYNQPGKEELLTILQNQGHAVAYVDIKKDNLEEALRSPGDMVAVAGGDGSVAKVAMLIREKGIPMAILPFGTANNFAKSLGLTGSAEELMSFWNTARKQKVDLGLAKGPWGERPFLEAVGWGLSTHLISTLDTQKEELDLNFESRTEELCYIIDTLKKIVTTYKPHNFKVTLDGKDLSGDYLMVAVMNIKNLGPNLLLAPDAETNDEHLDLVLFKPEEREGFLKYLQARMEGKIPATELTTHRGKEIVIDCTNSNMHLDDEVIKDTNGTKVHLTLQKRQLDVLVPGPAVRIPHG
jgi:diacylglycerol kinase (ATP)